MRDEPLDLRKDPYAPRPEGPGGPTPPGTGPHEFTPHGSTPYGSGAHAPTRPPQTPPASSPLPGIAVAALVVSCTAFVLGLAPVLGFLLGAAGVVLAVVALRRRARAGLMALSIVLSSLALLASVGSTAFWILVAQDVRDSSAANRDEDVEEDGGGVPLPGGPALPADALPDGDHLVGESVQPGLYRSLTPAGENCYWERTSGPGDDADAIIVNGAGPGSAVVEVLAGDYGFNTSRCGGWVPVDPTPQVRETIGDGDHLVGIDVAPGVYTAGSSTADCFWKRSSSAAQGRDDTIDIEAGLAHAVVEIKPGDVLFTSHECGEWTREDGQPDPLGPPVPDGDHLVGDTVLPGVYRAVGIDGEECYWERDSALGRESDGLLANSFGAGPAIVELLPSDRRFSSTRCGGWVPVDRTPDLQDVFGEGDHLVGVDIAPGRYAAERPEELCRWVRGRDATHDRGAEIEGDYADGPVTVEILPTDVLFSSESCGEWRRVG
ncbi:hypothetical protein [Kineococcus xinjiangensis]|nr:hypothetical protein [Kineococcus xinjiangensis]